MSTVYRDRDRFDDSRSAVSARTTGGTKVTRYIVKDDYEDTRSRYDDRRSNYDDARSRYDDRRTDYDARGDTRVEETRILRTSREDDSPHRDTTRAFSTRDAGPTRSRETITIRRDEEPERRREYWREPPGEQVEDRELVVRRTVERDDGRRDRDLAVSRVDDRRESRFSDYEVISPQRTSLDERDHEVQRYIRTSEYYQPPAQQQPQTIIIRQEPIIIRERERARDEDYQIVKKSDVEEERSVSRRSEPRDEQYFFEKRVRERIPEDTAERRLTRREVSPGDSISQVGRRGRNRGYESDDSMVYVRKEKITEDYSSDEEGHRKRDLAAGVAAGVGAAELIRRHHEKEGKEVSRGGSRIVKDVGAGIVGAVAAEGIRRYRSKSRRRGSRSRSRSGSRGRHSRHHGSRSRSRSNSNSNLKNIGGLGLAAAAVAAGALLASRNKKDAVDNDRRSRSRTRRSSRSRSRASSRASLENDPTATDDRNPATRNKKTAIAGAVGAAAMAVYERHRSKSRGRGTSGSPNRLKQGAPIAAAGLAAAGLAHMYEKRKAKEEATEIIHDEHRRARSRGSRSRSRRRTDSIYSDGLQRSAYSDPNLISYGNEPLQGNNYGEGYYGRPGVEHDYYNNSTRDIVPAPAPPPAASSFDATSRRPRSTSRTRSLSPGSGRSRSRSRGAAAAAAAIGTGVAASEFSNRRKEKKERKRRSREGRRSRENSYAPYTPGRDPYEDANWHATHSASYSQGINDPYASQTGFYPSGSQFPPPPGSMPHHSSYAPQQQPQNVYAPQDFPPPPAGAPQAQQAYFDPYAPGHNPYAPRGRGDENVSAATSPAPPDQHAPPGVNLHREMAMSPPIVGPAVTLERPSVSTVASEPTNSFPGNSRNLFQDTPRDTNVATSRDASPRTGAKTTAIPIRPNSRAAQTYTPVSPAPRATRERSASAPRDTIETLVAKDTTHSTLEQQPPTENPRVASLRDTTSSPVSQQRAEGNRTPEMQQMSGGNLPFMPSPDARPPSDESLPFAIQHLDSFNGDTNGPIMPALSVPDLAIVDPIMASNGRRDRSRSKSDSRKNSPNEHETSRAFSPAQDRRKKSVSFAAKPEFDEAPRRSSGQGRHSDRGFDGAAAAADEPVTSRERVRDRAHRHDRRDHLYDAGDDFSDDTPFEDHRRRSHDRDKDRRDRGNRHTSRRERSEAQSLDRERERDRDHHRDPKRANMINGGDRDRQGTGRRRTGSPDSDSTIELPDRFDGHGRQVSDRNHEEEVLAEKLDQILGGLFGGASTKKR